MNSTIFITYYTTNYYNLSFLAFNMKIIQEKFEVGTLHATNIVHFILT